MRRFRHCQRLVTLVIVLAALLHAPAAAAALTSDDEGPRALQPAMLDVTVNRVSQGQTLVLLDGTTIWLDMATLKDMGVTSVTGDRKTWNGRTFVRLASLAPGITGEFDERALTLALTVAPALLPATALDLLSQRPHDIEYKRSPSAFLNYGAFGASSHTGSVSLEAGASAGGALVSSTVFGDQTGSFRRGLTSLTVDDRNRMNRYVVGDAVAETGVLGGSVQVAGVSVSRDFSLDPYFVRLPTIGLSGAVMTPSRVEIYVNNQLVRVEQLPAGVYQLNNLPLPVGSADTRVVVRDAFGGEQSYSSSYYISQNVLGRGVQQFSYTAGAERLDAFDTSWEYGQPMLLGLHRFGLTNSVTVGGRVEASRSIASGGPMITARIGALGQVEAVAGFSESPEGNGMAASLAYEYIGRAFSLSAAARQLSPEYTTLSTALQPLRPRLDVGGSAATRVRSHVTVGASWQSIDYYLGAPSMRRGALTGSVTLSRRASLYVSATRTLLNGQWATGAFAGLGLSLTARETANISAERNGDTGRVTADVQRALPTGTGYGYRVQSAANASGGPADVIAELEGQTSFGRFDVGQTVLNGQSVTSANVSGGLVFIGGGVHATRAVQEGFALVRVPDAPNVRTYLSHQEVGRTNRNGDLVVPNLLPYYGNRLSIADSDVPLDRDVPRTEMTLAPPYRGGAIAVFPAPRPWRVTGRIVVLRGTEVTTPANWELVITLPDHDLETTLGDDGMYYVEGVPPGDYRATVKGPTVQALCTLHVPDGKGAVVRAGVTTCGEGAPGVQR